MLHVSGCYPFTGCSIRFGVFRQRLSSPRIGSVSSRTLSHFRVIEHVASTQHTRHWPRGTEVGCENALKLAVKQYIPKNYHDPHPGDVTFIAAHANGFPKVGRSGACVMDPNAR